MPTLEPQPSDTSRLVLLLVLLLWLMVTPDNGQVMITGPSFASSRLHSQREAHGVMNGTKWGDFSPRLTTDPPGVDARYLNMTGFRQDDGYAWEDLGRFRDRCQEWSRNAFSSDDWDRPGPSQVVWKNATGRLHGEWVRRPGTNERQAAGYNLSAIAPEISWLGGSADWQRNVTGEHGTVSMVLEEYEGSAEYVEGADAVDARSASVARQTSAFVLIQDEGSGSMVWSMRLHGVHWPRQGAILLTTSSDKFYGIFGLPHLAPGPEFFTSSQKLLNITLDEVLRKREKVRFTDPSDPWTSVVESNEEIWDKSPRCEYIVYAQLHPLDAKETASNNYRGHAADGLPGLLDEMERELRFPTGAPFKAVPDLRLSMVAWSPDCGYFLESKGPPNYASVDGQHLVGVKEEVFLYEVKTWILALAAVYLGQIWLLKAQMKETSTPSTIGRVSFYTAATMLLADGIIFSAATIVGLASGNTWLACLLVIFASFVSMFMGGAFLSDIYRIQEPERRNRDRDRERNRAQNNNNTPTSAGTTTAPTAAPQRDTLPAPATASPPRPPSPPIIIPSDQDIDAEIAEVTALPTATTTTTTTPATQTSEPTAFSSILGRLIFLGLVLLFLSVSATSWSAPLRACYANALAALYLSLWVPQIVRNVQRNSRRAFSWRFMVGQSALRLAPLAYFYLREDNLLFADPDWRAFGALVAWVWCQLWVLAAQDVLGPRFGVPRGWVAEAWEYHPVLREDSVEAGGLPIGLVGVFGGLCDLQGDVGGAGGEGRGGGGSQGGRGGGRGAGEEGVHGWGLM
ncbi:hypothetical protein B0T18DRAFT_436424 [Schizothecium vesticola]|uniref:RING-type E3 ubiquitin transferase n=1 Tax=Schizothecium vesticola TaxID=314040 RepID=A0AA40F7D9_9PEZI|nr:hypothetical protein B0T18DRAFT_436424 [Schizothecium vesticola]